MNTVEYTMGLAAGIIAALIIFAIFWRVNRRGDGKPNGMKGMYDERQDNIRGKAYKHAFFLTIVLVTLDLLADGFGLYDKTPITHSLGSFIILMAGVMTFAMYCILHDAYFGIGMNSRSYYIIMTLVIIINAVSAGISIATGQVLDGDKLAFGVCSQIIFVICFAVIIVALHVRSNANKTSEDDEEV